MCVREKFRSRNSSAAKFICPKYHNDRKKLIENGLFPKKNLRNHTNFGLKSFGLSFIGKVIWVQKKCVKEIF